MRYQWCGHPLTGFKSSGNTLAGLLETLEKVRNTFGVLEVINEQYKSGYPLKLIVEIDGENNAYCPSKSGPKIDTLYYNNVDAEDDYTEVINGYVHNIFLTSDFDFMVGMVREFWDTGDVKELKYRGRSYSDHDEEDDEDEV